MRAFAIVMTCLVVLVLSACTSVKVNQDYDPQVDLTRHGTWQWRDPIQPPTGDIRTDNPLLDQRIRRAIANHLNARNISYTDTQPDLLLSYHLVIEQKIQSDTYHTSVGVGRYHHPWYGGLGTETRVRQYDQSRLTIDILAADTNSLIWRGVGTYRPKAHKTPQDAAAAMQTIIDKILAQFPPARSLSMR